MKVLLEAPILTQSGYGEHSRLVYRSIKSKASPDVKLFINPLNWGMTNWISKNTEEKEQIESCIRNFADYVSVANNAKVQPQFDIQIHVGIPSEFEKKAPYSICVTAGIETDRVSPNWLVKTHSGIDKLIVPSEHAKRGFVETSYQISNEEKNQQQILDCASDVSVVPYPVKTPGLKSLDFNLDTEFNFLSVALLGHRKNLEQMICWFVEEFKDDNVGLVLKTARATGSILDRADTEKHLKSIMSKYPERKCKVFLLHGSIEDQEIHSLYNRDDIHAYVSAAHGEGYGLPLFEAAYSGMPIIAPDWSGHLDFLVAPFKEGGKVKNKKLFAKVDYELKPVQNHAIWENIIMEGSRWAYPKEKSFKTQLRNVYRNQGMYKKWASALQSHILETHSEENVYKSMVEAIASGLHPGLKGRFSGASSEQEVVVFE